MDGDYRSKLLEIMPLPRSKPFVADGNWEKYQIDHVVSFSPDYIDFISIYGSGSMDALDDLQFCSPWHEQDDSSWHQFAERIGWAMNKLAKKGKSKSGQTNIYIFTTQWKMELFHSQLTIMETSYLRRNLEVFLPQFYMMG